MHIIIYYVVHLMLNNNLLNNLECPSVQTGSSSKLINNSVLFNWHSAGMKAHLTLHPNQHAEYVQQKTPAASNLPVKQPTIKEAFLKIKKWDINDPRAIEVHNKIGEMIALDCQPFQVVENIGFKRVLATLQSKYEVCNPPSKTRIVVFLQFHCCC